MALLITILFLFLFGASWIHVVVEKWEELDYREIFTLLGIAFISLAVAGYLYYLLMQTL